MPIALRCAAASLLAACAPHAPTVATAPPATADAVAEQFAAMAATPLWPGFDPRAIPLAIFDGERTILVGHPHPPSGFHERADRPGTWVMVGRHPDVVANTSARIGGVATATLLLDPAPPQPARAAAATAMHEAFHVFQRRAHPRWSANEAALFTYPVDDARVVALRDEETEALRRALAAAGDADAACWSAAALALRAERFARLDRQDTALAAYERASEWNEGLANY